MVGVLQPIEKQRCPYFYLQSSKGRGPNSSGLGRAIINRKVKDAQRSQQSGLVRIDTFLYPRSLLIYQSQFSVDSDSSRDLKSITQEKDLDELLNTARLAGTEFTAGESFHQPCKLF